MPTDDAVAPREPAQALPQRLEAGLRDALRRRDLAAAKPLRSVLGALDNAGAVPLSTAPVAVHGHNDDVPRRELSDADVRAIVRRENDERREALATYEQLGQDAAVATVRAEIAVLEACEDDAT